MNGATCPHCGVTFEARSYHHDGEWAFYHCPKCLSDFTVRASALETKIYQAYMEYLDNQAKT